MKIIIVITIVLNSCQIKAQDTDCSYLVRKYSNFIETEDTEWILEISFQENPILIYYGAIHSKDTTHVQFAEIEKKWRAMKPDIAFFEGPDRGIRASRNKTISELGESGFVRFLAKNDNIPSLSLEAPIREIEYLSTYFSVGKIKLFYLLREAQIVRERNGFNKEQVTQHISQLLLKANKIPSLQDTLLSIADIEATFQHYWGTELEWWQAPSKWFDPIHLSEETGGIFTNEINRKASEFRDLSMYEKIVEQIKRGKKVFAVVGRNHVPMQSAAIKCEFEKLHTTEN